MRPALVALMSTVVACSGGTEAPKPDPAEGKPATDGAAEKPAPAAEPKKIDAPTDVAAPPADAIKTASGLSYKILSGEAAGDKPSAASTVTVHYTGWTTDGNMFDSSVTRGQPAKFPLQRVIPGWTEGLQLITKGQKARLWIPEEMAYKGQPGKPAGMLVFDVELIDFKSPLPAPTDVAAAPADSRKTPSGLAYKVLTPGTGTEKPTSKARVTVHYSGWTTDGNMFDSSVMRDRPATFPLEGVIKGWTEGLQLMVQGEKTRFWIPKELAYNDQPGKPAGMLVFDVELISFNEPQAAPAKPADGAAPAAKPQ